jgi:hypothetical protein
MFETAKTISKLLNVSYIDYPQYIWERGGDLGREYYQSPHAEVMLSSPLAYLGNRQAITTLSKAVLARSTSMVMLRDPRDCLVSMYFSFLGSHATPRNAGKAARSEYLQSTEASGSMPDINYYVLSMADGYKLLLEHILNVAAQMGQNSFMRYEDCIYNKKRLHYWIYGSLHDLVSRDSGASGVSPQRCALSFTPTILHSIFLKLIALRQGRIPRSENPQNHVRIATPGDHTKKLKKNTISQLDNTFGDILNTWYQRAA